MGQGNEEALQALMPFVYDELRDLARRYLRREPGKNTLQSAGLVHEAYFKLVDQKRTTWKNRAQFVGVADVQSMAAPANQPLNEL